MLKVALLAASLLVAASISMSAAKATNVDLEASASPAVDAPCRSAPSLDLACSLRVIDANGDGTISPAELASFAAPVAPTLDFKDAATEPGSMLAATLERDGSHRMIPALFALGALVILLRRRPT